MTNELGGSDYHLDIGKILEGVNFDELITFDGGNETETDQLSSILALVSQLPGGDGTNPDSSNLRGLMECTLDRGCFTDKEDTLSAGFIDCYLFSGLFSDPPCNNEFNEVLRTVNITAVLQCFGPEGGISAEEQLKGLLSPVPQTEPFVVPFEENIMATKSIHRKLAPGQTSENPLPEGTDKDSDESLDLVLCLAGALLPTDAKNAIMDTINDLLGIAGFVFDVIEKGIYIPGE